MIRDILIPKLKERYPDRGLSIDLNDNPFATFAANLPEVGAVTIYDEGDDVVVEVEKITHGHLSVYDNSLSQEAVHQRVSEFVLDFLDALFADKVLLWVSDDGQSGGWQRIDLAPEVSPPEEGGKFYVWSGERNDK